MPDAPAIVPESFAQFSRLERKIPQIRPEEEVPLAQDIEAGLYAGKKLEDEIAAGRGKRPFAGELREVADSGAQAKQRFIEGNYKLAIDWAMRYRGRGLPVADLTQEAVTGLIRGVEGFDYTQGYKFSTYGSWRIRKALASAIGSQSRSIRLPEHIDEQAQAMDRLQRDALRGSGQPLTDKELAGQLEISLSQLHQLRADCRAPLSLDTPLSDTETPITRGDTVAAPPSANPEHASLRDGAVIGGVGQLAAMGVLDACESDIVNGWILGNPPRSARELGEAHGVQERRVRQIGNEALGKLAASPRALAVLGYDPPE
jgi:DNA-directed RNA polymerase sigma subunit (sigma70/sigma32)